MIFLRKRDEKRKKMKKKTILILASVAVIIMLILVVVNASGDWASKNCIPKLDVYESYRTQCLTEKNPIDCANHVETIYDPDQQRSINKFVCTWDSAYKP